MPAQNSPAVPAMTAGASARQTNLVERDTQLASALATDTVQHSRQLRGRVAAVLQRADTRLRRSETLLASSGRRLTVQSYGALPATERPADGVVPSQAQP